MALLWIEGFEGFGTTGAPQGVEEKYLETHRISFTVLDTGRLAGYAWKSTTSSNPQITTEHLGGASTIVVGFGFKVNRVVSNLSIFEFYEPGKTLGMNLQIIGDELRVRRGSTTLATTSTLNLQVDTWYYIEFKVTVHNSAGAYELRVDETTELSASSIDTQASSFAQIDLAKWIMPSSSLDHMWFDDIYILDNSGSNNNDFLGKCRVDGILPDAAGDQTDFTPSAGANYAAMDENPDDGDTTYVESDTATDQDLYNYASMPASIGGVRGVQINTLARLTDAESFDLKTLVKSGTTTDADSGQPATNDYRVLRRIVEEDPDTSALWTESGINAAQFGLEVG
jgi:hypothetical protein